MIRFMMRLRPVQSQGTRSPGVPTSRMGRVRRTHSRRIRRGLRQSVAKLESGLAILASVGATAPFVGLFGTVRGIYHALIGIGFTGQATIDKVAGR